MCHLIQGLLTSMANGIITKSATKSIRSRGFIKKDLDPIDIVDTVNVIFLGPNAALSARNRKIAQKDFSAQLGSFGGDFGNFSLKDQRLKERSFDF